MALKQKSSLKIQYSMGEVCEMFDLSAATIRYWEKSFTRLKPAKGARGTRKFSPEDIELLKVIYHLVKEKGMTIAGADKFLQDNRVSARRETNVVEILQRIRATLVDIRTEIITFEKQQSNEIVILTPAPEEPPAENAQTPEPTKPLYYEPTLFDI